jgi:dTDP-4-amino-4,6-dideoxygalactose transaminase
MKVPFNQPYVPETYIADGDSLRGLGKYYESCRKAIRKKLGFEKLILTGSCTAALEIVSLALEIQPGDEVILPSYTYVSTANAFALRGAKLVFVDSYSHHPSIDLDLLEKAITKKTKVIVIVHYGGIAIDYDKLKKIKARYKIPILEDAAHCFGSRSEKNIIGSVGDFAAFSFHETKNISCGQGGALIVNNAKYWNKVNMISQCGTNKLDFIEKNVPYYSWKTTGSNYLLAEPLCAILLAGLRSLSAINKKRSAICQTYYSELEPVLKERIRAISPIQNGGNGHIFYLSLKDKKTRDQFISYLKKYGIETTFHYFPLHLSEYYLKNGGKKEKLKNTELFGDTLVRLPLFYQLSEAQQQFVIRKIKSFFNVI